MRKKLVRLGGAVIVLTLAITAGLIGVAGADLTNGQQITAAVALNPDPITGLVPTAGIPFASGQTISVVVPTNTLLPPVSASKSSSVRWSTVRCPPRTQPAPRLRPFRATR